jgi:hypothetical protein
MLQYEKTWSISDQTHTALCFLRYSAAHFSLQKQWSLPSMVALIASDSGI